MEKRLIVDLSDVSHVRLECKKCGAAAVFPPEKWKAGANCPACYAEWVTRDSERAWNMFGAALVGLQNAELDVRVRFEVADKVVTMETTYLESRSRG